MTTIDLSKFEQDGGDEYERQIRRVNTKTGFTASIETTTKKALETIQDRRELAHFADREKRGFGGCSLVVKKLVWSDWPGFRLWR